MKRIFEKITQALIENGNIDKEEEEVYQYALQSALILGGNIALSLMIGICIGTPQYCILFLCVLIPLRSDAGGYHAANLFICYLLSFVSLILTMLGAKNTGWVQLGLVAIVSLCALVMIFLFAPLESKNKPIETCERRGIRRRARVIVCLEWLIGAVCLIWNRSAAWTIWSAIGWCGIGYIAWFLEGNKLARDINGRLF